MKRFIITATAVVSMFSAVYAQTYEYEKISMVVNPTKIVILSPDNEKPKLSPSEGFTLESNSTDKQGAMWIYSVDTVGRSPGIAKARSAGLSQSMTVLPCYSGKGGTELFPDGYINVKLKALSDSTVLHAEAERLNLDVVGQDKFMPLWYSLHIRHTGEQDPVDKAMELRYTGKFASASPSLTLNAELITYDPDIKQQWNLYNREYEDIDISVGQAWDYATGKGIKIAIVDSGVSLTNEDLVDNIYPLSYDAETGTSPSAMYSGHGTHCAGIAAAVRNNGKQIAGVAPDAKIMSISNFLMFTDNLGKKLAEGINWAWKNGADIISCSWRYPNERGFGDILMDAIDNAAKYGRNGKGCVIVFAAGNYNKDSYPFYDVTFPANENSNVIAVSNMSRNGELNKSSCFGPKIFVAAPGDSILSTVMALDSVKIKSGTSMACPHVAGVAALVLERNPTLTAQEVKGIIGRNAKKVGTEPYIIDKQYGRWNEKYGYGLVDAYQSVLNTPPPGSLIIKP